MNDYINNLQWRYATKKFDSSKKLTEEQLNFILDAVQLSASSYGLQPYHVFVISDREIREKLKAASWGQVQITESSHLIVFANQTTFKDNLIDDYLTNVISTRNLPENSLQEYGDFMKSKLTPLTDEIKNIWTSKQTYLALGNLLSAAASIQVDACPMEGFDAEEYNNILGLSDKNLNASVIATIGFRSENDETQHYKKVRKSKDNLFTQL
ncbi:NAD(P)H-dependent oxidoreductase [uncultured Maribacter sp.]|uniref:NAD(P)H-dependent oxidoreductase n=1 Tax=uncultured Maribacter sp. TaxID=431308 RepID=UPI0026322817|nr:NAD(P)H-dependent oxidoreductase [uncultured Maribacter sp.]